ncbi:MAG: hypothetical protein AUI12_13410 [Acidobacteria bacterium 13_2_20CM_2_57_6]|nr:MAG: hypothetical protein AUI12_13410 [Acidobacteria bacterium 13_2_20CM_2_57_6]PYT41015.1 MAG: hypothetical protein DMG45_14990 [Acidobacteriota bacterium]
MKGLAPQEDFPGKQGNGTPTELRGQELVGGPSAWAGVNSETRNQKLEIGEQKLEISSEERSRSLAALGMTGGGEEERGKTRNQKAETRKQNVEEKMAA